MVSTALIPLFIPYSEKMKMKPPYDKLVPCLIIQSNYLLHNDP
jgi:hypothetical protein